jgi:hypothetical protein
MQASFLMLRALEEVIKKEHNIVSWNGIIDTCLQQVSTESDSKVSIPGNLYKFVMYHVVNHFYTYSS